MTLLVVGYIAIAVLFVLCVIRAAQLPREAWRIGLRDAWEWTTLAFRVWWHERRPKL